MWKSIVRWWYRFNGWRDCPVCGQQTLCWVKDVVFHPEEPPCFFHWECSNPACLVQSDIQASVLMDEAAREKGYSSFQDFADKKLKKDNPNVE